jgi:hypothetical protein
MLFLFFEVSDISGVLDDVEDLFLSENGDFSAHVAHEAFALIKVCLLVHISDSFIDHGFDDIDVITLSSL